MSPAWLFQQDRYRTLLAQVETETAKAAAAADEQTRRAHADVVAAAETHARETVTAQVPRKVRPAVTNTWATLPTGALDDLAGFTSPGSPLARLFAPFGAQAARSAADTLVTGLILGQSPRVTARALRDTLGTSLTRALTIARTETLRAYREASRRSYTANSDVVDGWVWHSATDRRTCPACWAMHGTRHRLDERLDGHPACRCAMVPVTKPWAEIGDRFGVDLTGVPETRADVESGAARFARLPESQQREILGPSRYEAYKAGRLTLDEHPGTGVVGRKLSAEWGSTRSARPLRDIVGAEDAKGFRKAAAARQKALREAAATTGPNEVRDAAEVVARIAKAAEPRVTAGVSAAAATAGGRIVGLGHRLKTPTSIAEKIERQMADGASLDDAVAAIGDSVRFTAVFDEHAYVGSVRALLADLDRQGHKILTARNTWGGGPYRGLNVVFESKDGQRFEVQFHTERSYQHKQSTHDLYEEARPIETLPERKRQIAQEMTGMADRSVPTPLGAVDLP